MIGPVKEIVEPKKTTGDYDLDKLALAVAHAETWNCKTWSAKYNNCFWIIRRGKFVRYEKTEDSFKDFKQLWDKFYGAYPNRRLAMKYTWGDRVENWIRVVNHYYNK